MTIGFYTLCLPTKDRGYVGAILLTDKSGMPVEFKCTSSITPTPVQNALYGKKMEKFIAVDLCGKQLNENIDIDPDIIFVGSYDCLDIFNLVKVPTLFVSNSYNEFELPTYLFDLISDHGETVSVYTHSDTKQKDIVTIENTVREIQESFDLMEAFDRLINAVDLMYKTNNL